MKTWGIKSRVVVLSLLPASLIAVMLGLYLMSVQIGSLEDSIQERGRAIARQLAPACEYGVFSGNRAILESLARSALHETDVRSVTITDATGKPLASAGKRALAPIGPRRGPRAEAEALLPAVARPVIGAGAVADSPAEPAGRTPEIASRREGDVLSVTAPIRQTRVLMEDYIGEAAVGGGPRPEPEAVLGWVTVELSLEPMAAQRSRIVLSSLALTAAGLLVAAALGWRMGRRVSDPILHLADTVKQLGEGRLDARARTDDSGELHTLETGINVMAAHLQESQERLQERVRQATDELRGALDRLESQNLLLKTEMAERQQAEERMRMLSSIVEHTSDIVCVTDRHGVIQYVNPGFEQVTGYGRDEAVGKKTNILKSGSHDQAFYRRMWDTLLEGRAFREVLLNKKKDGAFYFEDKTILPLRDDQGRITHFISTGKDISELMRNQAQLDYLAFHDPLTNLPNRSLFRDRLEHALNRAHRQDRLAALLFLDLDRFKTINDSLGHAVGDRLLKEVSRRLLDCARESDTVARLGGDEFTVILEDLEHPDQAIMVAQKVLDTLVAPFRFDESELHVTCSIGIALYPLDEREPDALIKAADTAMYHAKEGGRNNYQFYSSAMTARITQRLAIEMQLRRALERDEFVLHYQPVFALSDKRLLGAEALLRWQHPVRGLVLPHEFVPVMEETGLILSTGDWVLRQAAQQQRAWNAAGADPVYIAVNISTRQIMKPDFTATVARLLEETKLEPQRLCLEITESVLLADARIAGETLRRLKDAGVTIALDDFGTGFSSLSYLRRFPVDIVKIDREFVRNVAVNPSDEALVETIVYMAHRLGLKVIAEGVETEAQLALLRKYACDAIQGYLSGPPAPGDRLLAMLQAQAGPGC